jgi:hypothetical protein
MGVATQAEAAKRKLAGYIEVKGCAYWVPVCGTVMGSGPDIESPPPARPGPQHKLILPIFRPNTLTGVQRNWSPGEHVGDADEVVE